MKLLTALVFTAIGLAAFDALGQSDKYVFDIVAETDPDQRDGFVSILGASMNTDGAVAFAAIAAGETVPAVFFTPDESCDIDTCVNVPNAVGPVLNNDDWIVFLALDDDGRVIGISRYNPGGVPSSVYEAGDEVLGGIASTSGDPPDYIAYWSACLDPRACTTIEQCVVVLKQEGLGDCVGFPDMQLSAPAINDDLVLSYVKSETGGMRRLVLGDQENALEVGPNGFLSSPTINAGGTVAVFCDDLEDPDHEAGIYTVKFREAPVLFEPLDGDWVPAANTRPFINEQGAIAFTAAQPADDPDDPPENQAIIALTKDEVGDDLARATVIAAGDTLDGAMVVDHSLELFGRNSCEIIFTAVLDDGRTVLVRAAWKFDLDNDGKAGVSDLLALLAAWDTDPSGPPDFDDDGNVGLSDFLALLANWGPCP